jgi:putative drug exporter of the RND superfamily
MFATFAKFALKYKIPIIIIWVVASVVLFIFAPSLSEVGVTDDTQFLPRNTESNQALELLRQKFTGPEPLGSALVVVYNQQGLTDSDFQAARNLRDWLLSPNAPKVVTGITSIFDNNALRSTLISQDQTTMLISIDLSQVSTSAVSRGAVSAIREHIQEQHYPAQVYITGDAGVATDILTSIQNTIDRATLVTIILVIVLLLMIYRSPVAILVPLITIGLSYLVARGIAGFIGASGVNVSSLVDAYLVVTLFGIGTDYCLFMVSRFKEELIQNDRRLAIESSVRHIGPVILASAATVIVALLCLSISQFGMNRTSGYILAIGVAITLLAGLTLTPSLISLFGGILLWPAKLQQNQRSASSWWSRIGRQITHRPLVFLIPIIIVLALPYMALPKLNYSAALLDQMPQNIESVEGYDVLKARFATGALDPLKLIIENPGKNLTTPDSGKAIADIADSLQKVNEVSRVRYFSSPAGQLAQFSQQSQSLGNNLSLTNLGQLSFFSTLGQNLSSIAIDYPGITRSTNFQQAAAGLSQISTLSSKIKTSSPQDVPELVNQIKQLSTGIAPKLQALADEFNLHSDSSFTTWLKQTYFSSDGTVTRMDVLLSSDPYSSKSIDSVGKVREVAGNAIKASSLAGANYYVGGTSAGQADILSVNGSDFVRVLALAIIGILLVTGILLRSLIAPLYMILTVLFNFGATMGISVWLFIDVLKQNSMIYMLPIFVFVILIAVGSDYNIFLVSRIREEAHRNSLKEAICNAIANTGGVITSCGIILAGTFGALTTASLQMVFQVGAAIGIGVLIDTFLVRALLVPAIATLVGKLNWWPNSLKKT